MKNIQPFLKQWILQRINLLKYIPTSIILIDWLCQISYFFPFLVLYMYNWSENLFKDSKTQVQWVCASMVCALLYTCVYKCYF